MSRIVDIIAMCVIAAMAATLLAFGWENWHIVALAGFLALIDIAYLLKVRADGRGRREGSGGV